jgi:hypothetical protein
MWHRPSFDAYVPVALFSVCHFVDRWNETFGHVIKSSHVYASVFLGIVLLLGVLSIPKPKPTTWRNRFVVALVVPYIASVIAFLVAVVAFHLEHGDRAKLFPMESAFLALFAPYVASAVWLISLYAVTWTALAWYRASAHV